MNVSFVWVGDFWTRSGVKRVARQCKKNKGTSPELSFLCFPSDRAYLELVRSSTFLRLISSLQQLVAPFKVQLELSCRKIHKVTVST